MAFIDYYKVLGIDKSASTEDIKKVYRKLARKHHPDLNPNDKQSNLVFQQINEANEVLSDPEKRKKYDEYGENWKNADQFEEARRQQAAGGGRAQDFGGSGGGDFGGGDFSDFFGSLFGNQGRSSQSRDVKFKGQDYRAELRVPLREAFTTHQQTLTLNDKKVRITIPAGIADGQVIKLKGHGSAGVNGGPAGDLFITFVIDPDAVFKRVGDDLFITIEVDLYTAVLGGEVTVETLGSAVKLKVKPELQNNTKVRLKGKGFPVYKKDGEFGDLIVTYNIKMPTGLTEKQKELFRELSKP
ncbi:MAG: J domain-containing protein [Chitinophagaceae bacterium]